MSKEVKNMLDVADEMEEFEEHFNTKYPHRRLMYWRTDEYYDVAVYEDGYEDLVYIGE